MLWDDLEERMGIYGYVQLIHFVIQEELTQHYKANTLQFKKIEKNPESNGSLQIRKQIHFCIKYIYCIHLFIYNNYNNLFIYKYIYSFIA